MSSFEIVDFTASNVIDKPDMQACGITPGVVLYHKNLFPRCTCHPDVRNWYDDWLDEEKVTNFVKSYPAGTTFALNLEGPGGCKKWGKYPWQWYTHSVAYKLNFKFYPKNLDRLIRAVQFCRSIEPANRWTVYGHTPNWIWYDWTYKSWLRMVRECKPLADVLDFCCPSFYLYAETVIDPANKTDGNHRVEHSTDEWLCTMRRVLDTCHQLFTTPIYAWVWPEYDRPHWRFRGHQDEDTGEYPYQLIDQRLMPEHVWRGVMDTARNHADGAAIWGLCGSAPEYKQQFKESWPWWNVVRDYALTETR